MSLILEALRKSEAQRRRGQAPTLSAELPPLAMRRPGRLPPWAWIATAIALLLLGAWWLASLRALPDPGLPPAQPAMPTTPMAPTTATPAPSPPPATEAFPPVERIAPPARTSEVVAQTPATPPAPVDRPPATAPVQPALPAPAPAPDPIAAAARRPSQAAASARTPTVAELPAAERSQLPALKLSMHMWNEQPARRFVILDGNRYGEGDRLGAAVITAIDTDGVMLDLNGRAVRLPLR